MDVDIGESRWRQTLRITHLNIVALFLTQRTLMLTVGGGTLALGLSAAVMMPTAYGARPSLVFATIGIALAVGLACGLSRGVLYLRSPMRTVRALRPTALAALPHVD